MKTLGTASKQIANKHTNGIYKYIVKWLANIPNNKL